MSSIKEKQGLSERKSNQFIQIRDLNLSRVFKLPSLSKYNKDFLDVTIGKLTKSYDFKAKDINGTKMENLFINSLDTLKSKLTKRLDALNVLVPGNKFIKLSGNQTSFLKECKRWLEKAISSDAIISDDSFINEFKLTESGDIYRGESNKEYPHGNGIWFTQQNNLVEGKYFNGSIEQGLAKILYSNGEFYTGQVNRGGERNGHGVYFYMNGDIYDGQFIHNDRIGQSRLRFIDGSEYIGQFIDDEADGHGIFTDNHGNRYMTIAKDQNSSKKNEENKGGYFLRGRLYGRGEINFKNGDFYQGEFKGSKREGYGEMKFNSPLSEVDFSNLGEYQGSWKNDVREGTGEMTYIDGSQFTGIWRNDERFLGELKFLDGSLYTGYFQNNKYSGEGKLELARGITIEGKFENNEIGKIGKLIFQNGNIFEGFIEENNIGHSGKLIYKTGEEYEGFFMHGLKHGFGIMIDADGNIYEGKWQDDRREGEGKEFLKTNQEFYEGNFKLNKRDGHGKCLNYKGKVYDGQWRAGEKVENIRFHHKVDPKVYFDVVNKFISKKSKIEINVKVFK